MLRAGWTRVRAGCRRSATASGLPPRRRRRAGRAGSSGCWRRAAFIGVGVAIAYDDRCPTAAATVGRRGRARRPRPPRQKAKKRPTKKKAAKPKGLTKAQKRGAQAAVADRAPAGLHDAQDERLRPEGDVAGADRAPGRRRRRRQPRVLLHQGRPSSATTRSSPSTKLRVAKTGQEDGHALLRRLRARRHGRRSRAAASACASGSRARRIHALDTIPLDSARFQRRNG